MSALSTFSLTDKVVLITGGVGFLGTYFSQALAQAGATVVIADINVQAAATLAQQLKNTYQVKTIGIEMDVTKRSDIEVKISEVISTFGRLDVVVNNAALDPKFDIQASHNKTLFENYSEEAMQASVNVNMLGYWRVAQVVVQQMLQQGQGHIINISSIYGVGVPHQDVYPAGTQKPVDYGMTKSAIQYLTRYIAGTYGRQGIRSNALVLGGVFKGHSTDFIEKYGQYTMLGRMTAPEEVGAPLVFLASEAAKGMTGHLLAVDAGWTAW